MHDINKRSNTIASYSTPTMPFYINFYSKNRTNCGKACFILSLVSSILQIRSRTRNIDAWITVFRCGISSSLSLTNITQTLAHPYNLTLAVTLPYPQFNPNPKLNSYPNLTQALTLHYLNINLTLT
jgi:hypothetical protein